MRLDACLIVEYRCYYTNEDYILIWYNRKILAVFVIFGLKTTRCYCAEIRSKNIYKRKLFIKKTLRLPQDYVFIAKERFTPYCSSADAINKQYYSEHMEIRSKTPICNRSLF